MEQIYTIPVNEAFDECRDKPECGCPFCRLFKKLEEDELDIILGASMMEPDIRIRTNEDGFCLTHYNMMLKRRRMLGMGLMMESHLGEVKKMLRGPILFGNKKDAARARLKKLGDSCYVCSRIEKNMGAMIATAVYLFDTDPAFVKKFSAQKWFCLPHYTAMLEYASKKMSKKSYAELYRTAYGIEDKYLDELSGDVSWFCKKFDYRYDEEPWYNAKGSVNRGIKFLAGSNDEEPWQK